MEGGTEDIEFLARSETRVQILKELHKDGELGRDELRNRIDASRTTIQRNLEALIDQGWVRDGNRTYTIESCGEIVADDFLTLVETVSVTEHLQPILQWVDRAELDIDLRLLADAEVVTASPGDPWAMVNRHVQQLKQADDIRALLPLTGLHAIEVTYNRVVNHDADVEYIATDTVIDTFQTDSAYRQYCDELLNYDQYRVYHYDGDLPYYLGILDEVVQIGVDEDGEPRALLETETNEVREWAVQKFSKYKSQAEPISLTE